MLCCAGVRDAMQARSIMGSLSVGSLLHLLLRVDFSRNFTN